MKLGTVLLPIVIALTIAIMSFAGNAVYRHELEILRLEKEAGKLRLTVYRHEKRDLEYRSRFTLSVIQFLRMNTPREEERASHTSALKYYTDHLEVIREERADFIEENKHRGE